MSWMTNAEPRGNLKVCSLLIVNSHWLYILNWPIQQVKHLPKVSLSTEDPATFQCFLTSGFQQKFNFSNLKRLDSLIKATRNGGKLWIIFGWSSEVRGPNIRNNSMNWANTYKESKRKQNKTRQTKRKAQPTKRVKQRKQQKTKQNQRQIIQNKNHQQTKTQTKNKQCTNYWQSIFYML